MVWHNTSCSMFVSCVRSKIFTWKDAVSGTGKTLPLNRLSLNFKCHFLSGFQHMASGEVREWRIVNFQLRPLHRRAQLHIITVWGCCVVIIQRRGKRESYEAKAEQKKRKEKRKAIGPNHFSSIWRNEYAPNVSNTLFPVIHSFIRLSTVRKPVLLLLLFKRIKRDTLTLRKQRKLTRTFNDKH